MVDELVEIQHYEVLEDRVELVKVHDPHDSENCILCQLAPKPISVTIDEEID
jgi:hypothetical protein